jgi:hypothetical protein
LPVKQYLARKIVVADILSSGQQQVYVCKRYGEFELYNQRNVFCNKGLGTSSPNLTAGLWIRWITTPKRAMWWARTLQIKRQRMPMILLC